MQQQNRVTHSQFFYSRKLAKKKNNTKIIVYLSTLIYLVIVIHFSLCLVSFVFALVKLLDKVSHPSLLFSWQKTFHILPNFYIVWSPIYPSYIGFFVIVLWLYTFYYQNVITKFRDIINIFILFGLGMEILVWIFLNKYFTK